MVKRAFRKRREGESYEDYQRAFDRAARASRGGGGNEPGATGGKQRYAKKKTKPNRERGRDAPIKNKKPKSKPDRTRGTDAPIKNPKPKNKKDYGPGKDPGDRPSTRRKGGGQQKKTPIRMKQGERRAKKNRYGQTRLGAQAR